MRILVIDDEESMRHMLSVMLGKAGYDVAIAESGEQGLEALNKEGFDFVLCDIRMPGIGGTGLLEALAKEGSDQTVIMMSAYGTIDLAIECMKLGAYDFISKPFKSEEIILTIRKAEEREFLKHENRRLKSESMRGLGSIVTEDKAMAEILELVKKVSDYDTTILVGGESGTGKELIARAIHDSGKRAKKSFVAVNCGAIPGPLLESELFGYVKGAFTDAVKNKPGLFHEADGGTLFLDEVGELPLELQVKLLRVLEEREVRRVGDTKGTRVDVRIVSATARDLAGEVREGRFREDLFYRLNVINMKLPSLRERGTDVALLADHFASLFAAKYAKDINGISKEALGVLSAYVWPGNVRELENVMERAVILENSDYITRKSLPFSGADAAGSRPDAVDVAGEDLSIKKASQELEKRFIEKALERTGGNRTAAAKLLELSHRALLYKIKSYGL